MDVPLHLTKDFSSKHFKCAECEKEVTGFVVIEGQIPNCTHKGELIPCGHVANVIVPFSSIFKEN